MEVVEAGMMGGSFSRGQLRWYLFGRVLVITLFLGGTIVYQLRTGLQRPIASLPYLYLLVGTSYLQALLSAILLPGVRRLRAFCHAQLVWDLGLVCCIVYFTGGIDSLFSSLYILIILSGAVFLSRRDLYFVASAAAILYGSLLDLQYYGYLPVLAGLSFPEQIDGGAIFYAVFVNVCAYFLTVFLSGTLIERLRRSEQAREEREIDFGELANLNRTILGNISSGLMTIDSGGRIRSFNAAAAKITGYSLEEVYDQDVRHILPDIELLRGHRFVVVNRAEGAFVHRGGGRMVLGYATTLVKDPKEEMIGLLMTFQDLTRLKEMEDRLKRADRLAALGRLSSGMAHEIRNPLASISGSVQLLMEGSHVSADDRRLMGIVVKEADRLSQLLSDFLFYAKPAPLQLAVVNVASLLDEVAEMACADPRFPDLSIDRDFPSEVPMRVDRQQLHQAIWNLVINGAEAMACAGELRLGIDRESQAIFVEDEGPGMPEEVRDKIFEPFFTTKDRGTGLGLATVHAIVEAHGGTVEASAGRDGGSRFVIRLPEAAWVGF